MHEQAYIDIPYASRDCEKVRSFFQREYNVLNEDVFEITDTNTSDTKILIREFHARLEESKKQSKNILCIHVYAGHGA